MTYKENNILIEEISKEIKEEDDRHKSRNAELIGKRNKAIIIRDDCENGLDIQDSEIGNCFIDISISSNKKVTKEVLLCFDDAIKDGRNNFEKMKSKYFGVKSYAHWDSQQHDSSYGMGPTHGSIWFSVGFKREKLEYIRDNGLTEDKTLSIIRYLKHKKIEIQKNKS